MDVSRRQFFKICAGGMAGTTVAALGFTPKMALAQARNYKLLRAKEIRNSCTYCSVGCGLLMYSLGDGAKNAKEAIYHIEGDPDPSGKPWRAVPERGPVCWIMFTVKIAYAIRNTARRVPTSGSALAGMTLSLVLLN
ncbi:Formate dehydrogenase N alpha subunit selenocysteine-containing [Salmonella enterica subsp. enterica]|nr:Formate dehydrogenase N alpha subunit selenocysteine-containing [Salmonella enterica subsp. enterica]